MSYRSIQQQVNQLFDRADHPNIAHKDDSDYRPLLKIKKLPISPTQSIQIIKDVLQAIIYVSSHLIIYKPCQKHGRWGLCNIICYRDPNQNPEFNPDRYYPLDYDQHPNQDSELAWSLGRMWFQLLTDSRIPPIKTLNQQQLSDIITTSGIKQVRIVSLLKQILTINKNNRLDLVTIVKSGLFQYQQKSKIYFHSVIPNLSQVQQMGKLITLNRIQSKILNPNSTPYNPFQQQIFKRDFKQAILIAQLFQKVKQFIFNTFSVPDNNTQLHFCCYIIDLVSYIRLNNFKLKRQENQYLIVLLYDKLDYTNYLQKLLELEGKLQRKRKMKKFQQYRQQFPKLLDSPHNLTKQDYNNYIYRHFKKYLMSFAKVYKQSILKGQKRKSCKYFIPLIQLMLVRSANYAFLNCRRYIFNDFITEKKFDLQKVLKNIEKCQDLSKLEKLQAMILELYFSPIDQKKNE